LERSSTAAVAGVVIAVLLLLAGGIAGSRGSTQDAAASLDAVHQTTEIWNAREAALRSRLRVSPGDDAARIRLVGTLIGQALLLAQESSGAWATEPALDGPESPRYCKQVVEALELSPQLAEAWELAQRVARRSQDHQVRARAWAELARMHQLLGSPAEGIACMEAAVREDPAWKRTLASLKWNGRGPVPHSE
jgi:hypothetical protein